MNSAEWSRTSCRVDRPALAAATDHNPARFGIQLSCVTPPRFGDADDRTSAEFGIVVRRAGVTDTARWVLDLDEVFGLGERSAQAWLSS